LGWTEDFQLISKLLSEVEVEAERLTPFHRRKLKPTAKLILDYYPALKSPFLQDLAIISVPLDARESRWSREVAHILTKMEVKIEKRPLVHEQQMDYVMDRRVLTCLGPYSYYGFVDFGLIDRVQSGRTKLDFGLIEFYKMFNPVT